MDRRILRIVILISLIVLTGVGCSSSSDNPALPSDIPANRILYSGNGSHHLWGIWHLIFDESGLTVKPKPIRNLEAHFDITDMLLPPVCDDCVELSVNSFDPVMRIFDADITLRNPSQVSAYDVRGILYTNDYSHELRNDDGWTKLFDIPDGSSLNPFKAFAKDVDNRKFKPSAEHSENYQVYIPEPPGWNKITFAVTASWPGNCKEPYDITNFWQETINAEVGSSGKIYVDVCDWQVDVNKVTLVAPEITGEDFTQFTYFGSEIWSLQLTNNTGTGGGRYQARIIANSSNSGDVALYDYVEISIIEEGVPVNPVDVTPPMLNFPASEFAFDGDYAFSPANYNGMHILDISNPSDPKLVRTVQTGCRVLGIAIENGYAYLRTEEGICVVDIDPPESAYFLSTVDIPVYGYDIAVSNGYAYVVGNGYDLQIIDIDPVESAHVVHSIESDTYSTIVATDGNYAYVAGVGSGLLIFNIKTPESAYLVNTVSMAQTIYTLSVSGGYAFAYNYDGFHIIDISPPETASVVKTIDSITMYQVAIEGNYAYAAAGYDGMHIIDISNPASPTLVKTVEVNDYAYPVSVHDGYAYAVDFAQGFHVIDITPPESAHVIRTVRSLVYPEDVSLNGDYAFVIDYRNLKILDVSTPESADIMNTAEVGNFLDCVEVADGFAYMGASYSYYDDFNIVDIDPVESAHIVISVENLSYVYDIAVYGKYAYIAAGHLCIIDIDPPESAYVIKIVYMPYPGSAHSVEIYAGHAYVAAYEGGLQVVDIYSPMEAHLAHAVDTPGTSLGIAVADGYAYVADGECGLQIIDIDPLLSSFIVNTVDTPGNANEVVVYNGYAYVADGDYGLQIIDVDPPQSAHITGYVDSMDTVTRVDVSNGYAYVMGDSGLGIIKLW